MSWTPVAPGEELSADSIRFADDPWNEIIPGLFQGGHFINDPSDPDGYSCTNVVVTDEFDLVVSLYKRWGHGPSDHVPELHYPIRDADLTSGEAALAQELVDPIVAALHRGERVLVRCQAGYNRSGLVVALVLMRLGYGSADEIIQHIKSRRSKWALSNGHFRNHLRGLEQHP